MAHTQESELSAMIIDRFPLEIREYILESVELLANDFLAQGYGTEIERDNVVRLDRSRGRVDAG